MRLLDELTYRDLAGRRRPRRYVAAGLLGGSLGLALLLAALFTRRETTIPPAAIPTTPPIVVVTAAPTPIATVPPAALPRVIFPAAAARIVLDPDAPGAPRAITDRAGTPPGRLWVASPHGLYRLEASAPERWRSTQLLPGTQPPLEAPLAVDTVLPTPDGLSLSYTGLAATVEEGGWWFEPEEEGTPVRAGAGRYDPASGAYTPLLDQPAWDLARWRDRLYAITNEGVYALESGERVGPPLPGDSSLTVGFRLLATEAALYAGTLDGLWRWDGAQWQRVLASSGRKVIDLAAGENGLYALVSGAGVFASADGLQWAPLPLPGLDAGGVHRLAVWGGHLLAGGLDGLYAWSLAQPTAPVQLLSRAVMALTVDPAGNRLFVGTPAGIVLLPGEQR